MYYILVIQGDDRVDGNGEGKPAGAWEEPGEGVEEGSTSGVSTINSNKSPKESTVIILKRYDFLNSQVILF